MYKGELAIKLIIVTTIAILNLLLVGGYIYLLDKGNIVAAELLGHYSGGAVLVKIIALVFYLIYSLLKKY